MSGPERVRSNDWFDTNPMKRETIGLATLYLADCREVLPAVRADVVVTDPVWPNCPPGMLQGADGSQGELTRAALELLMPMRTAVVVLGFDSDPRWLMKAVPEGLPFVRSQQLPYAMPSYRGRLLGGDEMAFVFGSIPKGRGVIPGRVRTETTKKADRMTGHPCPRSDTHMTALVGWWSLPDDTIADPFMGTGATGVAAVSAGRKFVGIELDARYFATACQRIENAQRQQVLALGSNVEVSGSAGTPAMSAPLPGSASPTEK